VWITNRASDTITRLDVRTGALDVIPVGRDPYGIAVGGGAVWVASGAEETVRRVAPRAGRSIATIGVVGQPRFVAYGAGSAWATTFTTNTLVRIDAATNRPSGPPVELGVNPTKLVVSRGAVYAVSQADGVLERVLIPDR
jgi:DNA-binding beta-propeller fold protein YncE